jgi:hypothetical protein
MADIKLVMQAETAPIDRAVRVLDNLEAELRNVRRAEKQGLIDKQRLRQETERLTGSINRLKTVSSGSAKEFRRFEKSIYGSGKAMRQKEIAMQQAGYQLQDFIVQVQGGTNPLIAFSQQGSQLAGFFAGPWGAAIGLGIAALGSLGMAFMSTMGSAADFDDQMKEVESTLGNLTELLSEQRRGFDDLFDIEEEKIKRLSQASKDLLAIAKIEAFNSVRDLADSLQDVYTEAGLLDKLFLSGDLGVTGALLNIDTTLRGNITVWKEAKKNVKSFMEAVRSIDEQSNIQDMYESAVSARDIFKSFVDVTGELTEEQRNFWKELSTTITQLELLGATQKSTAALSYQDYGKSRAEGAMMDVPSIQQYADAMFAIQRAQAEIAEGRRETADADARLRDALLSRNRLELEYNKKLKEATKEYEKQKDSLADSIDLLKIAIKHGEDSKQYKVMEKSQQEDINKQLDEAEEKRLKALGYSDTQVQTIIGLIQKQRELNEELEEEEKKRKRIAKIAFSSLDMREGMAALAYQQYGQTREEGAKTTPPKAPKGKTPAESMASIIKGMEEQANLQRQIVGLSDQEADRLQILYDLKEQNKTASGKMTEAQLKQAADRIAAINAETAAMEAQMQKIQDVADSIETHFGDALMGIVTDFDILNGSIEDFGYNAEQVFKKMASEIIKELYRIFVVKKITGFVEGAITGTYADLGRVGAPSMDGGGYTGSGPRSGGLDGKGGFLAMLHPKETVIDHTKGQSGGVTIQQNFNFSANGDESVKRMIAQAAPQIAKMTEKGIMDSRRRGGQMKAVFG